MIAVYIDDINTQEGEQDQLVEKMLLCSHMRVTAVWNQAAAWILVFIVPAHRCL